MRTSKLIKIFNHVFCRFIKIYVKIHYVQKNIVSKDTKIYYFQKNLKIIPVCPYRLLPLN